MMVQGIFWNYGASLVLRREDALTTGRLVIGCMGAGASVEAWKALEGHPDKELEVFRRAKAVYDSAVQDHSLTEAQLYTHLQTVINQAAMEVTGGQGPTPSQPTPQDFFPIPNRLPEVLPPGTPLPQSCIPVPPPPVYLAPTAASEWKCPKVRFGRTELQMPIITCGGMRMQQTWQEDSISGFKDVTAECQQNFEAIVDRAMSLGINHFETARGYGCSELQYGKALKRHNRKDMIIQTKVKPFADVEEFKKTLATSFEKLDCGYVDLFGFHGINKEKQLDWVLNNGLMEVVKEYQREGKIRYIGFSTHAPTPVILRAIETGLFDYVNLHYHFIGSYFSEGTGDTTSGNLEAIRAAARHDMGVFIISPSDKGGMLYKPSVKFANACKPLSPIVFNNCWLWSHTDPPIHTLVVGAARPSDFDEHVAAAKQFESIKSDLKDKKIKSDPIKDVETRLRAMQTAALGDDWSRGWWKGLPTCYDTNTGVHVVYIVWLWSLVKAFGLHEYAKVQYQKLEANRALWDKSLTHQENCEKVPFDWTPGLDMSLDPSDLDHLLKDLSRRTDAAPILDMLRQAHEWLGASNLDKLDPSLVEKEGWAPAFDLQPDKPFPEREAPHT